MFDGSGFVFVARHLIEAAEQSPEAEALLRSAISRAYYAAFLQTRRHLRENESVRFYYDADDHYLVREALLAIDTPVRKDLAGKLKQLRNNRNRADYGDSLPRLYKQALNDLHTAEVIIAALAAL